MHDFWNTTCLLKKLGSVEKSALNMSAEIQPKKYG